MDLPRALFYSEDHIAVKKIKPNRVRLYLTEYIFSLSDEIEKISLDVEQNDEVSAGDVLGELIMSDGYVFEIISPVSGTVLRVNSELIEAPDIISKDNIYKDGWLVELESSDNLEGLLMNAEQYREFLKSFEDR